jgi:L-ascorbate metabolism protein UlaG (beta-lactamase superfamily)
MRRGTLPLLLFLLLTLALQPASPLSAAAQEMPDQDVIPTSGGPLTIHFIGHGTLMFEYGGKVIHVDPVGRYTDYAAMPKADLVLVTHDHGDHLDPEAVAKIRKEGTVIVCPEVCFSRLAGAVIVDDHAEGTHSGFPLRTVPAYNIQHMRSEGNPYHPKGVGVGFIITFGDTRVYVAGDTENTPEMKALSGIDIAFLPMNLPYTMIPEMVADAARAFRPRILYPYHFGETDTGQLVQLLAGSGIEVRIRDLK